MSKCMIKLQVGLVVPEEWYVSIHMTTYEIPVISIKNKEGSTMCYA